MRTSIVASMLLASTLAMSAADRVRVYADQAHGEGPVPESFRVYVEDRLNATAKTLGIEIVTGKVPSTTDALKGSRLLYLRAPSQEITAAERTAIVAFVRQGGSLFLVLDEEVRQSLAATKVNEIIEPFGMTLTPDTPYLHNCGGVARAGEVNKADRELPYSGGRAVAGCTPFAWQLDKDGKPGQPFAAFKTLESGARIIVMAEAMPTLFLGTPEGVRLTGVPNDPSRTTYWGKDSAIFMQEALAWLIK